MTIDHNDGHTRERLWAVGQRVIGYGSELQVQGVAQHVRSMALLVPRRTHTPRLIWYARTYTYSTIFVCDHKMLVPEALHFVVSCTAPFEVSVLLCFLFRGHPLRSDITPALETQQ